MHHLHFTPSKTIPFDSHRMLKSESQIEKKTKLLHAKDVFFLPWKYEFFFKPDEEYKGSSKVTILKIS